MSRFELDSQRVLNQVANWLERLRGNTKVDEAVACVTIEAVLEIWRYNEHPLEEESEDGNTDNDDSSSSEAE